MQDTRTTYELWVAAAAVVTTIVSALLLYIPYGWPRLAKQAVVAVISGVLSAVGLYYTGTFDPSDLSRTWLLVFLGATGVYVVLWKPVSEAVGRT